MKVSYLVIIASSSLVTSSVSLASTQYTLDTNPNLWQGNEQNCTGWQACLSDDYLVLSEAPGVMDWNGISSVTLNSITITNGTRHVDRNDSVIAIYLVEGDNRFGSYVGLSTDKMSNFQEGGTNTLIFDHLTLDPTKTYAYVFLSGSTTAKEAAAITSSNFETYSNTFQVEVSYPDTMPAGSGTIAVTSLESAYIPTVSYNFSLTTSSTSLVPEPATAALSLLALAGLAARRRRR